MPAHSHTIGAIDFGTRQVRAVVAQQKPDAPVQILGHGASASQGCVSQGVIQDFGAAQSALRRAIEQAENEAHEEVRSVYCGINGKNVETFLREECVELEEEIVERHHTELSVERASLELSEVGKRVVSSLSSQEWYVDDLEVSDPVGLRGRSLKARVHFARIPGLVEDNIRQCVESLHLRLEDLVFLPLATALGCLTAEDRELGIAVLDVGRSNTGLSVHREGKLLGTHCFDWGGYQITRDVAACLQISFEEADELILEYGISGRLIPDSVSEPVLDDTGEPAEIKLKTAVHGAASIAPKGELDQIIYDRANELMTQVRQHLHSRGLLRNLIRGVVIAGGGAGVQNLGALGEAVFQVPCRAAVPEGVEIIPSAVRSPEWVGAVGVARHGFAHHQMERNGHSSVRERLLAGARSLSSTLRSNFI